MLYDNFLKVSIALVFSAVCTSAQILVVDQETNGGSDPEAGYSLLYTHIYQSFIPSASLVGYIRTSYPYPGTVGIINLRSDSTNGPVVATTLENELGSTNGLFFFPENVQVVPGRTYFLEPVIRSVIRKGIGWKLYVSLADYPNGAVIDSSSAGLNRD